MPPNPPLEPAHQAVVRFAAFALVLLLAGGAQALRPRRKLVFPVARRWPGNLGIAAVNTAAAWVVCPLGLTGIALLGQNHGLGLLGLLSLPAWAQMATGIALLDLTIYWQHRLFHTVPALWRIHATHHADPEIDVSTGVRFHPVEIALSVWIKAAAILLLGVPPAGVLAFEVLLNATSLFNHANLGIPAQVDHVLRRLVVTPDMHRVHHSVRADEMHRNFGFNLPWWDWIFGTYRDQPREGHDAMVIGLAKFRDPSATIGLRAIGRFPLRPDVC